MQRPLAFIIIQPTQKSNPQYRSLLNTCPIHVGRADRLIRLITDVNPKKNVRR